MCSWIAWQDSQRRLGTSPVPCVTPPWQVSQPTPRATYSACSNLKPAPTSIGDLGGVWHVVHFESFGSSSAPLKWLRRQVVAVAVRCWPWTICEWHDVERSFLSRRISVRCGVWSKGIDVRPILKSTFPSSRRVLWQPPRMHDASDTCAHGLLPSVEVTYFTSCVLALNLPSSFSSTPGSKWQSMQPTPARPCDESSHDFTYGTMLWHDAQNCGVVEYSMNA